MNAAHPTSRTALGNVIDLSRLFEFRRDHRPDVMSTIPWEGRLAMYQKKFGKTLQFLREQKGWSREQLAEKIGVSAVMVWKYENGEHFAETALMCKMAYEIFGVSMDALIGHKPLTIQVAETPTDDKKANTNGNK